MTASLAKLALLPLVAGLAVAPLCTAVAQAPAPVAAPSEATAPPQARADAAYQRGTAHYDADRFAEAARAFHEAFAAVRSPFYLFNAARAEQRAGDNTSAERDFLRVLELSDVPEEMRSRVAQHLDELRTSRLAQRASGTTAGRGPSLAAGVGGGAGLIAAVIGAVLLRGALADDDALAAEVAKRDAAGKVIGLEYADYLERRAAIVDAHRLGHGLLWAGLAVGVAGGWWLTRSLGGSDAKVALLPAPRAATLRVEF